ncbi:MAG: energy transducer TonB [Owenweeksia sp.]
MKKITLLIIGLVFSNTLLLAQDQENIVYTRVEVYPVYEGCESVEPIEREACFDRNIQGLVSKNFTFPESARKAGVEGTLTVSFIVEKDGSVSDLKISKGIQDNYADNPEQLEAARELETEALRSVAAIKISKSAMMKGKPVRMKYTFPIEAKLSK